MTQKKFWDDPYQTDLDTLVAEVAGDEVTLQETIFYAFSGGQESDTGSIGGREVLAARKVGSGIAYTLGEGHGLRPGAAVRVEIDWGRRYRLMRLHFAAELVLDLTYRRCAGIEKVGAHIAEDKARIDFIWPESLAPLLPAIQQDAADLIAADHPIISAFSDEAAGRRYWEIAGFARVPCGGTHLRRTGEVGAVELRRRNPGRGKERIEIALRDTL
jgi:Ser-tRNA(Ala) deacylase AlaX